MQFGNALSGSADPVPVEATLNYFRVELSQTTLPAGRPVRFAITNRENMVACYHGPIDHTFVIEKVGASNQPLESGERKAQIVVAVDETAYLDWAFDEPGEYQVACHLPGHYQAGVVTRITVTK